MRFWVGGFSLKEEPVTWRGSALTHAGSESDIDSFFFLLRLPAAMGRRFRMKWSWSGLLSWVWADVCPSLSPSSIMPHLFQPPPPRLLLPSPSLPVPNKIRRLWRGWLRWRGIKKKILFYKLRALWVLLSSPAIHSLRTGTCRCPTVADFFPESCLIFLAVSIWIALKRGVWNTLRWSCLLLTKGIFYLKPFLLLLYFCLIL